MVERMFAPAAVAIATGNLIGLIRWRNEDLWGSEGQKHDLGSSQGDRRRNRGATQDKIPGSWLDKLRGQPSD
jgi:hypothetical protein